MLDEITVTARIAKRLRERFDGLQQSHETKLDDALTEFQTVAAQKVDDRIGELEGELKEKADSLTNGLNNQAVLKTNSVLDTVRQYGQSKVDALVGALQELGNTSVTTVLAQIRSEVQAYLATVAKGDKGDSVKGDRGDDGVGISTITQPNPETANVVLTDGRTIPITLPRGPKGVGGGGGGKAALPVTQEFYEGTANFPAQGRIQVTYYDTTTVPWLQYLWNGEGYTATGGSGGGVTGYKDPTYTYTDDDLTRIDYATGEYQTFEYNAEGDVTVIDVVTTTGTTRFTFSYNADGSLHDVVESEL